MCVCVCVCATNHWSIETQIASLFLRMASSSIATGTHFKEIAAEIPPYIHVYKDGMVERPQNTPIVPSCLHDPQTGISSKDIVISDNPSIAACLFLPKFTHSKQKDHNQIQKLPILVYFHGGGFFFESAFSQLYHNYFNVFVSQVDVIFVFVQYRLAPEHLLPEAYDDCLGALQWVASHATNDLSPNNTEQWLIYHGDLHRIYVGGDSAGGNIVHNITMRAGAGAGT